MPIINKSGVAIHYQVEGDRSHRPLVMVHGNGNCLDDWYKLGFVKQLSPHFYLILIDMRGYGRSEKLTDPAAYTADCVAGDIIAVMDEVGVGKCHYYGNSRGGSIAFVMGKRYPSRFLSYFIVGSEPFGAAGPQFSEDYIKLLNLGMVECVAKLEEGLKQPFPPGVKENFLQNDPAAMIAANAAQKNWPNDSDCFLHTSFQEAPRAICYGELDELAQTNREYLKLDPHCKLIVFKQLTHAQAYWDSGRVAPEIINFVKNSRK